MYIKGNDVTKLASMAKLKGGRLARELSDSCLQYWGGMGYTSDVPVSRFYRLDSNAYHIFFIISLLGFRFCLPVLIRLNKHNELRRYIKTFANSSPSQTDAQSFNL